MLGCGRRLLGWRRELEMATDIAPVPRFRRQGGRVKEIETVGELLFWSYANLAAASVAETRGLTEYDTTCWMVRAKLFKGLLHGTMKLGTLFADVREMPSDRCAYCGSGPPPKLHGDHLIPRSRGGPESGDNLVWACRPCNSSKCARDLLEWYATRDAVPPLLVMKRYLKLAISEALALGVMEALLADKPAVTFSIGCVPTYYPLAGDAVDDEDGDEEERGPPSPADSSRREVFTIGQRGIHSPASLLELLTVLEISHVVDLRDKPPSRGAWSQTDLSVLLGSRLLAHPRGADPAPTIAALSGRILVLGTVKDPWLAEGRQDFGDRHPEWEVVHIHHIRHEASPIGEAQCIAHSELAAALRDRAAQEFRFHRVEAYPRSATLERPGVEARADSESGADS